MQDSSVAIPPWLWARTDSMLSIQMSALVMPTMVGRAWSLFWQASYVWLTQFKLCCLKLARSRLYASIRARCYSRDKPNISAQISRAVYTKKNFYTALRVGMAAS